MLSKLPEPGRPRHLALATSPSGTNVSSPYSFRLLFGTEWPMEASFLLNLPVGSSFFPPMAQHPMAAVRMMGREEGAGQKRLQDGLGWWQLKPLPVLQ